MDLIGAFRRRKRPRAHPLPGTLLGQYVRAVVLRLDEDVREPLKQELRRAGEDRWEDLRLAIFPIVVRTFFFHEDNIATIPDFAAEMQAVFDAHVKAREIEFLVRHALGQPADISNIGAWDAGVIRSLFFLRFADILTTRGVNAEGFINPIVIDAERALAQRGILLTPPNK